MHNYSICIQNCFDVLTVDFFTNQVTNILTEMVPFYKSSHIYIYIIIYIIVIADYNNNIYIYITVIE